MELSITGSERTVIIATFFLYTIVMLIIGYISKKNMDKIAVNKYLDEFYTGGRGMGSLVVALMIAAGLCSAGTFLGGPGLGYTLGGTWILVANAQNFMNFIVLGQVGKKIGIVSRRIGAQSVFGLLTHRFNHSKIIGVFGVVSIVAFMGSYVVAQLVGGARLFESMTGLSYTLGLILFTGVVVAVIAMGGIKGVAIAIAFQGLIMTLAVLALTVGSLQEAGSLETVLRGIAAVDPKILNPWSWPIAYHISMWINFGFVIIGLPHATIGALTYKDTRAMHKAIIIGAVFVILWTMTLPYLGVLAGGLIPNLKVADHAIPVLSMKVLPPWLAGITLAGVAGAIQSTVGAMIIVITSSIVKDAYQTYIRPDASASHLKKVNLWVTIIVCTAIFVASIKPPKALQYLIIFAIGGLASSFFWPILLGLYSMRVNEYGAAAGMIGGLAVYILGAGKFIAVPFGVHAIIPALVASGVLTVAISLCTPKTPRGIIRTWFGVNTENIQ